MRWSPPLASFALAVLLAAPALAGPAPRSEAEILNAAVRAPDRVRPELPAGVARTAVDGRLAQSRLSGALGFLCGRPDSLDERAANQPFGADPQGRFLGARLSLAFR